MRTSMRRYVVDCLRNRARVIRRGPAAAAEQIDPPSFGELAQLRSHQRRGVIKPTERIGQPGIGITADVNWRYLRQLFDVGAHLLRAERAVDSNTEQLRMRH